MPPPCANAQLMVLASNIEGALGTGAMAIGIANRGASCRIGGFPHVNFFNAKYVAVDVRDIHVSSMLFAEPRSATVTLKHDASASIGVSWSDNTVNNESYNSTCPRTVSMSVVLSHGVGHLSDELQVVSARPCGGSVEVTPIEAGAWPRPNG